MQIAHGRIIPKHNSAYSQRCHRYLRKFEERNLVSVGGLVFRDEHEGYASQYRSLLMTGIAFLRGNRTFEIYISKARFMRRKYVRKVSRLIDTAEVVIFEGPWQYPVFKPYLKGKKIVYNAHNVESVLRKDNIWKDYVKNLENDLLQVSDLVVTMSEEDRKEFIGLYGLDEKKVRAIPEGFEISPLKWKGSESNSIVFMASAYEPNIRAAEIVLKAAEFLPNLQFKIIGSVCGVLKRRKIPKNVNLLGLVDESVKYQELSNAVLALNPVKVGSGQNIKMIDYISSGVPVVTSEVGARGFDDTLKNKFFVTDIMNLTDTISEALTDRSALVSISDFFNNYSQSNSYEITEKCAYETIKGLLE